MTILIILAAAAVIGVIARPAIGRRLAKERLLLAAAKEEREANEARTRERALVATELIAAQPAYFADYGIKVAERRSTPRVVDTGTLHLDHDLSVRVETDSSVYHRKPVCRYDCGELIIEIHEIAPGCGAGVRWEDIGRYCAGCGAWSYPGQFESHFDPKGPLGRRLKGATNLFDALGPPKTEISSRAWDRIEAEIVELEARLNAARTRRLALAEQLGKPIAGGPFRPRLVENTGT